MGSVFTAEVTAFQIPPQNTNLSKAKLEAAVTALRGVFAIFSHKMDAR
jgi:hypothetical protein